MQWKTPFIFLPLQRYIQFLKMSSVFFFCPPRFTFAAQNAHLEFVGRGNIFADFFLLISYGDRKKVIFVHKSYPLRQP